MNHHDDRRRQLVWLWLGGAVLALLLAGTTLADGLPVTVGAPEMLAGASGAGDERDADVMPAIAYDPVTRKYLVVWLTPRHATSETDGLDVYGVFLSQLGRPLGTPFRISDGNSAARNALPTVAAAPGGRFAVAWTVRGNPCRIATQLIVGPTTSADKYLVAETDDAHTPQLLYQPARDDFVLAFVSGEDYLPPTLFGNKADDCGNNVASTSRVDLMEFVFINGKPIASRRMTLSGSHGGFRPRVAREAASGTLMVVWEDRRAATSEEPYRFDVYGQRLGSDLSLRGDNLPLATGGEYNVGDASATWTPRPVVVGGNSGFLAAWFAHQSDVANDAWSVQAALVSADGSVLPPFTVARTTYSQTHAGKAPTGSLAIAHNPAANEFLVGFGLYMESFGGYVSSALVQRVDVNGQLLRMDGSVMPAPGVGRAVDYALDDQLFVALAANASSGPNTSDILAVYSKRLLEGHEYNMDIFGVRVTYPVSKGNYVFLPSALDR